MGSWDVYCGICGGPLGPPYWESFEEGGQDKKDEEDENEAGSDVDHAREASYNPDVLASPWDPKLHWLSRNRIIGEAPLSYLEDKTFIADAENLEFGIFGLTGDHPNIAALEITRIQAYCGDGGFPYAVPMHKACLYILGRYLGLTGTEETEVRVVYEMFRNGAEDSLVAKSLGIDDGSIGEWMGQYRGVHRDEEYFVLDPEDIPELKLFYENLPTLREDKEVPAGVASQGVSISEGENMSDPFSRLSPELLLMIISGLDLPSFLRLGRSSKAVLPFLPDDRVWRDYLWADMPWLYGLPSAARLRADVDWRRVYKRLFLGARPDATTARGVMRGLANRGRIWREMLPTFGERYENAKKVFGQA